MSAALAESLAWSSKTLAEKAALARPVLRAMNCYTVAGDWGTAVVRCLDAETKQFRVLAVSFNSEPDQSVRAGYVCVLSPRLLASLKACGVPQ